MTLAEDLAVSVEELWVRYRRTGRSQPTAKTGMARRDALQGVSFTLSRGSVCGIVGSNGAGKSTMMKVLAGTLPPSQGSVTVAGKATLLAPGIGFKRNLSGTENAILGCLAQGLSRAEARERVGAVAALAGLEEVMDWPVHAYSSGMYSRLALAVALQASPDVLLVDEALSAGDFAFRSRVDAAVADLVDAAGSVMLISHSFPQVRRLCDRCIWMRDGQIEADGKPADVIDQYRDWVYSQQKSPEAASRPDPEE